MAAADLQNPDCTAQPSLSGDRESQISDSGSTKGGWITFLFIAGALTGLTLAAGGWGANLIVYLIEEFNVKRIDAAQISNVVGGSASLFPIVGAIAADCFFGSFSVIALSSCISLLGVVLLALTTLDFLRPQQCEHGSTLCKSPSKIQFAVLYSGIALATIGQGGSRFTLATMGADQFDKAKHQATFFNWYFFAFYVSAVISSTAIVYVEDNVSWTWGFGLTVVGNLIGLVIFLLGNRFYRHVKPQGSPFVDLARVFVAALRKRKVLISLNRDDYYYCHKHQGYVKMLTATTPTKSFRFLNRAALKTEGDTRADGLIAKPWRLCTVQQVEDLKTLIRIFPLWCTSIFLATPIGIQSSLTVLQALTMDRHLGPHFKIPAGSILVIGFISTAISITLIDRILGPLWKKLTNHSPTPLQRIGLGHILNALSMAVSALVESRRLRIAHAHHLQNQPAGPITPMLALWLFPQIVLVGIGEAFHFPGQVSLYYQEFPTSLRSTSTAMISLVIAIAFYLSTAVIDLIRRTTKWLPDDLNNGRLDNVYWLLTVVGMLNFFGYLVCARMYKHKNTNEGHGTSNGSDQ
ncbi:hypothetical protein PVL29_007363 [Vitis rotundifolia]|uniref:Uncharacterized protein n=1 Tax=Vitis rotundifolia TaxID=103349 RepID=A0AA38ZZJ8_VITRO|nr:hypothetical protein PVL29_007363 [Vitis rotundifolia]